MSGEPVRGGSNARSGPRGDVGGILILLALGLIFRVIIAYLLPGSGFANDISAFQYWASNLASQGLYGFYDRDFFHDYTPGYLYILWIVGLIGQGLGGVGDLIKIPPMLADLALAYLVWSMTLELGASRRAARLGAVIVIINPITWFDSVVWAQVDSFGLVFLLLGLRELWRDRPERSAVFTVIGALIKPQLGILIPIVAAVTIRRALRPHGGYGNESAPAGRRFTTRWEANTRGWVRIISTGLAGLATTLLISLPFGLSFAGLIEQIFKTAGGYPYLSVNAWNPWALVTFDGNGIASNSAWVCDMVAPNCGRAFSIGPLPAVAIGTALTLALFFVTSLLVARRPDRQTILVGVVVLAVVFFVVPTRVHERYLFPFVALGAILAAVSWRWRIAYLLSGLATLVNMYFVLTTLYPNNPGIDDWLGTGRALGSFPVVALAAITQGGVLVFALLQLRAGAAARLAAEARLAARASLAAEVNIRHHDPTHEDVGTAWPPARDESADQEPVADEERPARDARMRDARMRDARMQDARMQDARMVGPAILSVTPASQEPAPFPVWEDRPSFNELGLFGWLRHRLKERPTRRDRSAELHGETGGRVDRLDIWMMAVLAVSLLTVRVWRLGEPPQMIFDEVYHARTATEFLQFWRYGISHDIYEWTHPHVAKYAIAGGIVAWGNDRTTATSDLGVPVVAAVVEPRWDDPTAATRSGDRLWIATGDSVRAYDLSTRAMLLDVSVPGAGALALDSVTHRIFVGTGTGEIRVLDTTGLDAARRAGMRPDAASIRAQPFATMDGPVPFLKVTPDGSTLVAVRSVQAGQPQANGESAVVLDAASGSEVGRTSVVGVAAVDDAGTGSVALATSDGVSILDVATAKITTTIPLPGPALGLALATSLDKDRLYVSYQAADGPRVATIIAPGSAGTAELDTTFRLPGTGAGWVGYDLATRMVHVLGTRPDTGTPTVYVIEPRSNAVYADAALPFAPAVLVLDENQRYPSSDREQILAFAAVGTSASIDVGQNTFAWRLPGVLAGVVMAVLLYLLARILFRRREVALFLAFLITVDGMLFAQSRIGMNDSYVGLGIVAAYTIFAALWRWPGGSRRHWLAFLLGMPLVGVMLGFALASKWVGAYAIGALGILVLTRSALGRLVLIGGLILATTALGYLAISVPAGQTGGNYLFLFIMIGLTLVTVVANVLHPIAWTWEEQRLAAFGPLALGGVTFLAAIALGKADARLALGPIAVAPQEVAFALVVLGAVIYTAFSVIGRWGFGPMAAAPPANDPASLLDPPGPAPAGWLRPGAGYGLPLVWVLVSLIVIPVALYIASYIPWALMENYQLFTGWPPGHDGQTLIELTQQMYRYHNTLSSAHAASSPWWAWIFDFKPVWFYQESFAGGTSAAIYDSGNLIVWWLGIPAMAFAVWQAFIRRNAGLALIAIGFALQWLSWSRIDRAAFEYHYYTSLPFLFLALAYFLAELWHGASRRTWLLVRLAGAAAVLAPTTLWLFHRPLCAFVRVEAVNPGSRACPTLIPDFLLSGRAAAIAVVVGVGVLILLRLLLALADEASDDRRLLRLKLRNAAFAALVISLGLVVASAFLDDTPIVTAANIPVEPIALIVTLALLPLAAFVATARDARRFVAGLVVAMAGWFVLWYPNLSGLPLPSAISNAYQGLLPTYVYPFQFPVSTVDRSGPGPSLFSLQPALLLVTLAMVAVIVGYAAWAWRVALAEETALDRLATDELEADAVDSAATPSVPDADHAPSEQGRG